MRLYRLLNVPTGLYYSGAVGINVSTDLSALGKIYINKPSVAWVASYWHEDVYHESVPGDWVIEVWEAYRVSGEE